MLSAALKRLDTCSGADKRVYAVEQGKKQRNYMVVSPGEVWDRIEQSKVSHFYEVLSEPCNLYLDIEWHEKQKASSDAELARVNAIVSHVCEQLQLCYDEKSPTVTLVTASGQSAKGFKSSWHVHINCAGVCWLNAAAVGDFVRRTCSKFSEVDKIPYAGTGQNWRCVGSSKFSEPNRRFLPADRATFLNCTVQQPVAGRKLIYPNVALAAPVACKAWVTALAESLHAGGKPMMCGDDRCIVPFKERQFCEHANRKHRSNHQYAVINTRTLMWKMSCHACPDAISEWKPFSSSSLQAAFHAQSSLYAANAPVPAIKVHGPRAVAPDTYDCRAHGPPPFRNGKSVQCRDGVYVFDT